MSHKIHSVLKKDEKHVCLLLRSLPSKHNLKAALIVLTNTGSSSFTIWKITVSNLVSHPEFSSSESISCVWVDVSVTCFHFYKLELDRCKCSSTAPYRSHYLLQLIRQTFKNRFCKINNAGKNSRIIYFYSFVMTKRGKNRLYRYKLLSQECHWKASSSWTRPSGFPAIWLFCAQSGREQTLPKCAERTDLTSAGFHTGLEQEDTQDGESWVKRWVIFRDRWTSLFILPSSCAMLCLWLTVALFHAASSTRLPNLEHAIGTNCPCGG